MPGRDFVGHVVYASRSLRRRPVMVAAAILTLSLGLGATTAVLSILDAVLLNPIGVAHADDVVMLQEQADGTTTTGFLYRDFQRLERVGSGLFTSAFASGTRPVDIRTGDIRLSAPAELVTPRYFDVLGVPMAAGRALSPDASTQGTVEAVATDWLSRQLQVAPDDLVGREILVGRTRAAIVGVTAAGFDGLDVTHPTTIVLPITAARQAAGPGNYFADAPVTVEDKRYSPSRWLRLGGRLRTGADPAAATALWASTAGSARTSEQATTVPAFVPLWTTALPVAARASAARFTTLLLVAAGLLLVLGCATLAGVMTSRRQDRRHELAVRAALGAGHSQLVASLLAEGVLIAACGMAGGLVVAHLMLSSMAALVIPGGVSLDILDTAVGWRLLLCMALLAVGTLTIFGLLPALSGRRPDLSTAFNGGHHTSSRPIAHARRVAVAVQVAVCLVLAVGTLLFARSLRHALGHDVGVQASRLAYATVTFDAGDGHVDVNRYLDRLATRAAGAGSIERLTFGDVPLISSSMSNRQFTIDGVETTLPATAVLEAGPDYFETLGLTILSGRGFSRADSATDSVHSAVVSAAFAERAWPGETAVGRFITFLPLDARLEVVGIVEDASLLELHDEGALAVYVPSAGTPLAPGSRVTFAAASSAPERAAAALADAIREASPGTPLLQVRTLESRIEELAMPQRVGTVFVGWLGGAALVIAAVGIYGTVAGFVAGRRVEMAIRRALGASDRDMLASTLGSLAVPILVGSAVGILGAYGLASVAQPFLLAVTPGDPASFAVALVVVGTAVAGALITGARGALRAHPHPTLSDG